MMSKLPDLLASVASKVRRAQWRRGLFATAASVLGGIAVVMLLDLVFPGLPAFVRAVLSLLVVAVGCFTCWKFLVVPLRRPLDSKGLARRIEIEDPALEESVSTALWAGDRSPGSLGEAIDRVAVGGLSSASEEIAGLVRTRRPGQIAALLAGVLLIALVLAPHVTSALFRRAVLPFSSGANAQAAALVVSPGNTVVTRGDALEITVTGGQGDAFLEIGSERVAMERTGEGSARFVLGEVDGSFDYRVIVGAAESEVFQVRAVALPEAEAFAVRIVLPEYLGGDLIADDPALVETVVGSTLVPELELPEGVTASGAEERLLAETGETEWGITLKNELGKVAEIGPLVAVAREDRLPSVRWIWPLEAEITALPESMLEFDAESTDDFKVERSAYFVDFEGGREVVNVPLDLAPFGERGITELRVTARAWDACPRPEGQLQYGESPPVRVVIQRGSQDPEVLALRERVEEARRKAREAEQALDNARAKLSQNANRFERETVPRNDMIDRAEEVVEKIAEAEAALKEVEKLTASLPLGEELDDARSGVEETARSAAEAPLQSSADARAEASRTAAESAVASKEQMKALEKAIREAGERAEQEIEMAKLARQQERMAGEVEALAEGDPEAWEKERNEWARDQRKGADALARLEKKMERSKSDSADSAAQEALRTAASEARKASKSREVEDAVEAARRAAASLALATQAGRGESGEGSSDRGDTDKLAVQPTPELEPVSLPVSAVSPQGETLLGGGVRSGDLGAGEGEDVPPGFGAAVRAYFDSLSNE